MTPLITPELLARLTDSAPPLVPFMVCAYCDGFDRTDPSNQGVTHGMCPACQTKFLAGGQ